MKNIIFFGADFGAFFALGMPAHAENSATCQNAGDRLETLLTQQPTDCSSDSDCDGYNYRDSCAPPIVLPKLIATDDGFMKDLIQRQTEMRSFCMDEWEGRAVCEPQPFQ